MKKIFLILLVTFSLLPLNAQNMRQIWLEMPDSIVPYLNRSLRTELADYVTMGMKLEVMNALRDTTRIEKLTDDYILVQLSNATKLEIKSLDASTIAMVQTWCGPLAESKLSLFSNNWEVKPLNIDVSPMFVKPDTMSQQRYSELLDMANVTMNEMQLSVKDNSLTIKYSVPLLSSTDKKEMQAILRQRKLNWNGTTFK
ncbi:hypothetical protein PI172_0941 [Prevotella intermedia]|uniref:DUF3256 domain-containing protein n=1 Tax=Prevotella intermedia TaxID=28131 RepID=A0AAD1BHB3_PREIN|nr:DUF3256 family protein [Prevotella intermedia]AFJ09013.1 PF11644 family protein [Prevotella intermedia 17]APW34620.1 hypothetical protein BWX40_07140 [Prevotella intermedia]BAR95669.1 hypothetical protein PI172_0941 [Prevotella intermedia]